MAMIEAFVGAIVDRLVEKLVSGELLKFLRPVSIDSRLEEWRKTLLEIQAVLNDAAKKQAQNVAVKQWLDDLENLAYDLEDLVDKLNTEALRRELTKNKGSISSLKRLKSGLDDLRSDHGIDSDLKEISRRLEDLNEQKERLNLVENLRGRSYKTLQTSSLVVESKVYGREKDKEEILKKILSGGESNDSQISVIPIVGMGGIGKTTLVQLVYSELKDKFDLWGWIYVSDDFDVERVTENILESVSSGGKCNYENFDTLQNKLKETDGKCNYENFDTLQNKLKERNFDTLQNKLKESLSNKKFLVVLDDIWNENYGEWEILSRPFFAGKPGSTIIITTRQERVARIMSKIPPYKLGLLSEDDALSLLAQHAFEAKSFDSHPDLIEIGKSMVRRCKMLPLAVKAIGGLLRVADGPEGWEEVLKSETWTDEENSEILPALKLSYHHLPPELKRCFAYCALFPKDYEFDKFQLVHFWMAEGLLQESKKNKSIEDVGSQYFDELLARSFFQQSSDNASCFVMHDLLNDLAMSVAGDKCLRMDGALQENLPGKVSVNVRYLSFKRNKYETYPRFNFLDKVPKLRTFLPLPVPRFNFLDKVPKLRPPEVEVYGFHLSQRILLQLFANSCCLRSLSLNDYEISELPDSIGDLRHLRYLGLAKTPLTWLPESVCTLINLQVLILSGCTRLTKLPTSMENLINLRHLDISDTGKLHEMPRGIAQLTSLRTLTKMTATKNDGMRLKELGNLSFLQGDISIEELQNVVYVQEATDARLMDKTSLNEIRLAWSEDFDDSRNKILELDVLNALKPHKNLSTLEIMYYGGENFSNWIGDSAFSKLAKISFKFCENCTSLPPLGHLPSLRDLSIRGTDQVKVIGPEFYGNRGPGELRFPSLISLTFEDMSNWEEWHGIEGVIELPRLRKLKIENCSKLLRLQDLLLPSLRELEAIECNKVVLNHMQKLESLTRIQLENICGLTSVIKAFDQFPSTLESLRVDGCEDLATLLPSEDTAQNLVNLREVHVESCPRLSSLQEIDFLPGLRSLEIRDCGALELLSNKISFLKKLNIERCPSLKTVMKLQDCSTSLDDLSISSWVNLNLTNLLGSGHNYSSLTSISLWHCDGLESFPHGGLPTPNLRRLYIGKCQHLKSLPDQMDLLSALLVLQVSSCASLITLFPQGDIPPNLTVLKVYVCASLMELFPKQNIPPNLSHLHISNLHIFNCQELRPLGEWGLHTLTSLKSFKFWECPELVSLTNNADEEHCVLPPSLTLLSLSRMPNLETLSNGFQSLTSLQHIWIHECPKLVALPLEGQLQKLLSLRIYNCPRLAKRCLKNKGDYWPIIADIPQVEINIRSIYDPCL